MNVSIVAAGGIEGGAAGGEGAVDQDLRRRVVAGHEADRRRGDVIAPLSVMVTGSIRTLVPVPTFRVAPVPTVKLPEKM